MASQWGAVARMIDSINPNGVSGTHNFVYRCGIM